MLTYEKYNEEKFAVRGDRNRHSSFIKTIGGRWNSRMKNGEGWLVPIFEEKTLQSYINSMEKETDINNKKSEHSKMDDIINLDDNESIYQESEEDEQDIVLDPIILKLLEENNLFSNNQLMSKEEYYEEPEGSVDSDDTYRSETKTKSSYNTDSLKNLEDSDQKGLEELEQEELERLEQEKLEQEKLEQEKLEQEKLEQEKLEQEKLEQEKLEREKLEQEKLEQEKLEQEKLEQEKLEQEKLEQEKLDQEKLKQKNSRNYSMNRYLYDSDNSIDSSNSKNTKVEQDRNEMLDFKKGIMEKQRQKDIEKRKVYNTSPETKKKIQKNDSLEYLTRFNKKPSKFKTMYVESDSSSEGEVYASSSEYSESSDDFPSPDSPKKFTGNKELLNQIKDLQRKVYALEIKNQKLRSENLKKR